MQDTGYLTRTVKLTKISAENLLFGIHAYRRFYVAFETAKQLV